MVYRILLVDDEQDIIEFISYNLRREGYEVHSAADGAEAVRKALEVKPHLILLDVMMPGMDGYEACRQIRSHSSEIGNVLIAFLSARGEDSSQIEGFNAGADDYIPKPIRPNVLVSRVKALLKRSETVRAPQAPVRTIVVDPERHVVVKDGVDIVMPRKEFNLLSLLYSKPERVFSREEIYSTVWGDDVVVGDRTIDVHIRKLREKIGDGHIVTIKGVGYKYQD